MSNYSNQLIKNLIILNLFSTFLKLDFIKGFYKKLNLILIFSVQKNCFNKNFKINLTSVKK